MADWYPRPPKGKCRVIIRVGDEVAMDMFVDNESVSVINLPGDKGLSIGSITTTETQP